MPRKVEKRKTIQKKITETLQKLPRNTQILIEREEEKRRRILLQEAKQELWRRWRQKKGRETEFTKDTRKLDEEDRLKRIEREVKKHQEELEERKRKEEELKERKHKQAEKKKRWEMLRWIVAFIEERKPEWEKRKAKELEKRRATERERIGEKEERKADVDEGGGDAASPGKERKKRLKVAVERAKNWKEWRTRKEIEEEE